MLGAVDLGGLGENDGAAVPDDEVGGVAECRIGGEARETVRAAALQGDQQVRRRHRDALHGIGGGQKFAHPGDAGLDGLTGAPALLDDERGERQSRRELLGAEQRADLVGLAAESDNQHGGEVHMLGVAGDGPAQRLHAITDDAHAAAGLVGQRHDPVDIGIIGEQPGVAGKRVAAEGFGDVARGPGRAVHRGQHADIVARGDPAIRSDDPHEGRLRLDILRRPRIDAEGMVAGKVVDFAVMDVNVVAWRDVDAGEADDLAVAEDGAALGNCGDRHLVAAWNAPDGGHAAIRQRRATRDLAPRDDDIVDHVQMHGGG